MFAKLHAVARQVSQVVVGKDQQIRQSLVCLLAGGHLLIEDVPGVGKTTLAHALSISLGLKFNRLQFTSDDERVQLDRDIAALRHRRQEIPGEIAREQQAIRSRYSSPQYRVFPAAVTFVVPAEGGSAS